MYSSAAACLGYLYAMGYGICFTSDSVNNAGFIYKRFIMIPQNLCSSTGFNGIIPDVAADLICNTALHILNYHYSFGEFK